MSGRKVLAAVLAEGLPGMVVRSSDRPLDGVPRGGAVVLFTEDRKRLQSGGSTWFVDTVAVWVLTGQPVEQPEAMEDDLEDRLVDVLQVLEGPAARSFAWDTATRGVLADKFHGYRIPVTCAATVTPTP